MFIFFFVGTEEETEVKQVLEQDEQVKHFAQEAAAQDDDQPAQKNTESVEKALKQLAGDQKTTSPPPTEGKEDLNIGRLGMGGLKALEKINNLIKASAEAQGGDESSVENGLTDDQAQTIERMIIEGIRNIKGKKPNAGTRKAAIPRRDGPQKNTQIKTADIPNAPPNVRRTVESSNILKQKVKNTMKKLHDAKPLTLKAIIKSNNPPPPPPPSNKQEPMRNNVVKNVNIQRLPDVGGGLGVGNAGTGNEP